MKLLFSLGVSALFLYFALRGLDLGAIGQSLLGVNSGGLLLAAGIHLSSFWVRSLRWRTLLAPLKPIAARQLFSPLSISYLANNTLPMRAGEFVRAYLLGRKEGLSKASVFSSIMLERILDGLTLLLFLGVIALLLPLPTWVQRVGLLAGLAFIGVSAFLTGLVFLRSQTMGVVRLCLRILPAGLHTRVEQLIERFVSGLDVIQSGRGLFEVAAWSIVVWGLEALALFTVALACGQSLSVLGAFFVLVIINLGTMIPSSPGYVGTFEFFCAKSLAVFGILEAPAMGFALVLHVVQFVPITLVGLFFMVRAGVSLRGVALEKGMAA